MDEPDDREALEEAARRQRGRRYVLKLYVAGQTHGSVAAIRHVKEICEEHLRGRYDLEVVDLYQRPKLREGERIIAAPTLVKTLPMPLKKLIGEFSDHDRVLVGLDVRRAKRPPAKEAAPR